MLQNSHGVPTNYDLQSLGLFRLCFAGYLLIDFLANVLPHFRDFYGPSGVLPVAALISGTGALALPVLLILRFLEALPLGVLIAVVYPVSLLCFGLGFRTRLAAATAFAVNSYLLWRNPLIKSGAEDLAHLLLLWSLFLPMDWYWSIAAALNPEAKLPRFSSIPFVAMRLQISSLYIFSALFKLIGEPWRNGTALSAILADNVFGSTHIDPLLLSLPPGLLHASNYLIIAFQLAFPFLVYCPWRNDRVRALALLLAAAMHVSFIFCLNVGGFPYLALTMLLLLVPDAWIDRLLQGRRTRLAALQIYYDPECEFCRRVCLLLREFVLFRSGTVLPASADVEASRLLAQHQSWVVRGVDGAIYLKSAALAHLLAQNPALAGFGWLLNLRLLRPPADRLYDLIGANRHRLGPATKFISRSKPGGQIARPAIALCSLLAVLALLSNALSVVRFFNGAAVVTRLHESTAVFQVRQGWSLFAPMPTHWQHRFRIDAHRVDGTRVDLMSVLPAPLFKASADGLRLEFLNHRWLKYFTRFAVFTNDEWSALGGYLCRTGRVSAGPISTVSIAIDLRSAAPASLPADGPSANRTFGCPHQAAERASDAGG